MINKEFSVLKHFGSLLGLKTRAEAHFRSELMAKIKQSSLGFSAEKNPRGYDV